MTADEKKMLIKHAGHDVVIADYMGGEPITDNDGDGRFCLECLDCGEILLGARVMVGCCGAISVTMGKKRREFKRHLEAARTRRSDRVDC